MHDLILYNSMLTIEYENLENRGRRDPSFFLFDIFVKKRTIYVKLKHTDDIFLGYENYIRHFFAIKFPQRIVRRVRYILEFLKPHAAFNCVFSARENVNVLGYFVSRCMEN